jgi:hypothetical protein
MAGSRKNKPACLIRYFEMNVGLDHTQVFLQGALMRNLKVKLPIGELMNRDGFSGD